MKPGTTKKSNQAQTASNKKFITSNFISNSNIANQYLQILPAFQAKLSKHIQIVPTLRLSYLST